MTYTAVPQGTNPVDNYADKVVNSLFDNLSERQVQLDLSKRVVQLSHKKYSHATNKGSLRRVPT